MTEHNVFHVASYAKINLGLEILGKRSDNYHELDSIFIEIDLHDDIRIEIRKQNPSIELHCSHPDIPCDERNSIIKAYRLMEAKIPYGLHVYLDKRIPHEAGLAGGSSNAASFLMAINRIFNLNFTLEELAQTASNIGSDIPFFIYGNKARVTGRGEIIEPVQFSFPFHIVILKANNLSFSTKTIYENFAPFLSKRKLKKNIDFFLQQPFKKQLLNLENELELAVPSKKIKDFKQYLLENGAFYTAMTGSGSCVYGLFEKNTIIPKIEAVQSFYCKARYSD